MAVNTIFSAGMVMQTKKWIKPELIVLARVKEEEMVLDGCKSLSSGNSANNRNDTCMRGPLTGCGICSTLSNS